MSKKKVTIQDVAKHAHVSVGTVSNVLNDHPNIKDSTRARVLRAFEELGYRPDLAARYMRTKSSQLIGFITDEIAITPFAGKVIKGAQDQAWANHKVLLIVNTGADPDVEQTAIEIMQDRNVEAIIYATMGHRAISPPSALHEVPTILLNCFSEDRSLSSVVPDEVSGGYTATNALLRKGHRRIGFINLPTESAAALGRLQGYRRALADYGISYDEALVRHGSEGTADIGYHHALGLMRSSDPPTALFCGNDRIAMGVYDALRELHMAIPENISVIGFDNQEIIASYLRPSLTTVALPHYEMGQWAVNYLIEQTSGQESEPHQHKLECPLIERESI